MTFRVKDGQGAHALDLNQQIARMLGRGVISGGRVTSAAGDYAITVEAVSAYVNGTQHDLSETDLDLSGYLHEENPRKALVYVDTEGEIMVAPGDPEEPQPSDQFRFNCYRPAPPDMSATDAAVLAEIWLDPSDVRVTESDIRDRRVGSDITVHTLEADTIDAAEIIDGSGTSHTGELAGDNIVLDEDDVRDAIDSDPNHGIHAPHDYFSGSHTDLSDVSSDDHHAKFSDSEARDAVRGELDATQLTGDSGSVGQFVEFTGDGLQWSNPPKPDANVLTFGTLTHSGGSTTTKTLTGVSTDELAEVEMGFGVAEVPSWDVDYDYSIEFSRAWDSTDEELDIEVTLEWVNGKDPGTGNDLQISWVAYDGTPVPVEGRYTDADAVAAIDGADITPASVAIADRLNGPVYDDISTITEMDKHDLVLASGNGASTFGAYLYDGAEWVGPLGTSVSTLSELDIDVAKDWNGHPITNLGAPTGSTSAIRQQELDDHGAVSDAHHAQTTSSEIDHDLIDNVRSGQHHSRYTNDEAAEAVTGRVFTSSLTGASIPDGEYLQDFVAMGSGETLTLVRGELIDENGGTESGLTLELYDMDSDTVEYSQTTKIESGSSSSPLATVSSTSSVAVRIYNGTGAQLAASGSMSYEIN